MPILLRILNGEQMPSASIAVCLSLGILVAPRDSRMAPSLSNEFWRDIGP